MASRTAGVAFAIAAGIAGTVAIILPRVVIAAEDCLTEPTGDKSDAQRWYYRFDRGTNRRCWYLKDANATSRDVALGRPVQQPGAWDFAQPAAPKLALRRADGPAPRANSDALAELPQPRLRTDVDLRGTPKPQNLAITPTTLTASDASLPRGLDASSPWPSAPPQQTEATTSDASPPPPVSDGDAQPDTNSGPAADVQAAATSKASKPEAPIHMLMLVVIGALALSGLLASALYRLSRMGRRRRRSANWHAAAARVRRSRVKPRSNAKAPPSGMPIGRSNTPTAQPRPSGNRAPQPTSALEFASARPSSPIPEPVQAAPYRGVPAHAVHQDQPIVAARRRDPDDFPEMPTPQPTDAVWQAVDQLAERAAAQQPPIVAPMSRSAAAAAAPNAPPVSSPQMAWAQRSPARVAPAAQVAAFEAASVQAPPRPAAQVPSGQPSSFDDGAIAPNESSWPAAEARVTADRTASAAAAAPQSPISSPPREVQAAPPPSPIDVAEIVSALRKARSADAAGGTPGAASMDTAKVIAALLVSRAAKRRASQNAGGGDADVPAAAVTNTMAAAPVADAAALQTRQAAQNPIDRLPSAQPAAQSNPAEGDRRSAATAQAIDSADPAAALIETLRAHAARRPPLAPKAEIAGADESAEASAPAPQDPEMDDPAAALINLLQSRFALPEDALPEDEFETEAEQSGNEHFISEGSEESVHLQDDPAAQLIGLLESRASIPAAPQVMRAPQQPRAPFVPPPFEEPVSPPLDFIPRPQALRPRARNIQSDESLDGIQDILARLGRRA